MHFYVLQLGGEARSHDVGFIFSLRAILPWFNHQSIGNVFIPGEERIGSRICLPLPPELYNNEEWVGFALYVSFTLPPGMGQSWRFKSFSNSNVENLHRLTLWCEGEDNFKGSHRLLVIHIPRGRFEVQLNQCSAILAEFVFLTPGAEVEICGMRVVYEQDLKGLIQTITQCTIRSPLAVYNGHSHAFVAKGKMSCLAAFLNVNLIESAESSKRLKYIYFIPINL